MSFSAFFFAIKGVPRPERWFRKVQKRVAPALGSVPLYRCAYNTSVRGHRQSAWMAGGSRPALPGLHDVLCHSPCSDSFELHVAVVEPSAKTLEFGV